MSQTTQRYMDMKHFFIGTGASLAIYFVLLLLSAYLTVSGKIPESAASKLVLFAALISAFGGATAVSRKKTGSQIFIALIFWVCVLLMGFICNDTISVERALWLLAASATGGMLSLFLFNRIGGKKGRKKKARHSHR